MGRDNFFSEMNGLPPGFSEQFDEDAYIANLKPNTEGKGLFGDRKKFQEMIFGKYKGVTSDEAKLIEEIETLLKAKGYGQTQQGREILVESVKRLKALGIISG